MSQNPAFDLPSAVPGADYPAPAFAVVGMAGRFPGAASPGQLWKNLRAGVESITFFKDEELLAAGEDPRQLSNPDYVKANGRLDDIDKFDAAFFGLSPREAAIFDPQHRVFLEIAWEAFEDAGYLGERFNGPVAVFAASGGAEYLMHNLLPNRQIMESVGAWLVRHTGNDQNFLATRVSYQLNLTGPSMSMQSACSSSLLAVHAACQSLLNGECDMALAGGVTIYPEQNRGYLFREGEILSPDGHCRPFDAASAGTVMSSAAGCVLLRRLEDAVRDGDRILAIIRGSAVNNDGSQKVGYLAPSVAGQTRVVSEALALAGIEAEDVSYIEAHGTGTLIGDPIEITALTQAFQTATDRKQFCAIGSLKSNLGHTGEASGICSFIKTVLSLVHREIPASLNFEQPNPQIDFENSPFYVNTQLQHWTAPAGKRRIAGVTSLGAGGTNVHVLVEEAPEPNAVAPSRSPQLLVLSAKTPIALDLATGALARHLREHPEQSLADQAYTLLAGRKQFAHRRAVVASDALDAAFSLEQLDNKRVTTLHVQGDRATSLFFMFPGGGAQYAGMGAGLYAREPAYRDAFEEALSSLEASLQDELRSLALNSSDTQTDTRLLEAPSRALPALLATEYAIAKLLESWGITPTAMIGHSAGEYAAACLAGVITLREAMSLVALRGRLFETLPAGAMLSVPLSAEKVQDVVGTELSVAAINAPSLCVLSGPVAAIARAEDQLRAADIDCTRVHINVAAHSLMVDPILAGFERFCRTINFKAPRIPFISNVTGTWISNADATDPTYWGRQLRGTVRFADGLQSLIAQSDGVFCEIGPGRTLSSLVKQQARSVASVTPTLRHPKETDSDLGFLLGAVGRMWAAGVPIDAARLLASQDCRRVPLPTYPFERQRYWVDPDQPRATNEQETPFAKRDDIAEWFYAPSWSRSAPPSPATNREQQNWLILSDESSITNSLVQRLRQDGHTVVEVVVADSFKTYSNSRFAVDPERRADFDRLASALRRLDALPHRVVHSWALSPRVNRRLPGTGKRDPLQTYDRDLALNFSSVVHFAQAFAAEAQALTLYSISSQLQSLPGDSSVRPERSTTLGPIKVIPREYPNVACTSIDVALPKTEREASILVDRLMREFDGQSADQEIALRRADRWVRRYDPVHLEATDNRPWLRSDGVYLITGGLGGIGLRVAEHLAQAGASKLVLLARTDMPTQAHFDNWLATHDVSDQTSRRIAAVRAIQSHGTEVMTVSADVADLVSMRRALTEIKARFGNIHGVFHAAGVLNDQLIALREPALDTGVLSTKVRGALVLDQVLSGEPLDLLVLFSSVSSILGLEGQVDYTAANAFLDAFAHARSRSGRGRTLSIDWNAWREIGMLGSESARTGHPALAEIVADTSAGTTFRTMFRRSSTWLLDDHVVRGGDALIPGTGFLEIARAALAHISRPGAAELRDVFFLAPFAVPSGGERSLHVRLDRGEFAFYAESAEQPLVVGRAAYVDEAAPEQVNIQAIRARCPASGAIDNCQLVQHFMDFGPRWRSLQQIHLGEGEALIELALPSQFASDLDVYKLHPALMDLATGGAQAIVPGFDAHTTFLVPFSYDRVLIRKPLAPRVFSHVRLNERTTAESVVFDVTIYDENGQELVSVERFTMRRAGAAFNAAVPQPNRSVKSAPRPQTVTQIAIEAGMTPSEGLEALDRMLNLEFSPQVVACTVPLQVWLQRLEEETHPSDAVSTDGAEGAGPLFSRTSPAASFTAPRNDLERQLADLWSALLGVAEIGIDDDFFELGGHSLIAVRLFARIKKTFGVDLSLDTLFKAPTIAGCAHLIANQLGIDDEVSYEQSAPDIVELPAARTNAAGWSPLVSIQTGGKGTPFFCVHGAMGNVLNLRDLALRLGDERPFYALQAQGVDGKLRPLSRIEDMAAQYITAIRQVQPQGPYLLGGFSGGGVIAFEMAQQLHRQGERIGIVALLDTFSPVLPVGGYSWWERVAQFVTRGPAYIRDKLSWQKANRKYDEELRQAHAYVTRDLVVPLEFRETHLFDSYIKAQQHYQPEIYPGRLVLFRAREVAAAYAHADEFLGWNGLAADGIEVHEMPGGHDDFVLEPHVFRVVQALKTCLARADGVLAFTASRSPFRTEDEDHVTGIAV